MSYDCVTLSSDSSRPSSPNSDHEFELVTKKNFQNDKLSSIKQKDNLFSLSDSDSDANLKSCDNEGSANIFNSRSVGAVHTRTKRRKNVKLLDEEKIRKKAMKLAEKEATQAKKKYQRSFQPGECMKYVTAEIDEEVFKLESMSNLKENLLAKEQKFAIVSCDVKATVAWSREIMDLEDRNEEERVMLCLSAEEVAHLAKDGTLASHVGSIKDFLKEKFITLVICGIDEYFSSSKHKKKGRGSKDASVISRKTFDESLIHLQLVYGVGHRMVENSSELASLIFMFTKAIAETPFKRDKQEREGSGVLDWFARGDSKDCVRVDSSGNGCMLLWRQQLRQFNNVGLDVAEAIASNYPSPHALMKAYESCDTIADAQKLLQNIPVRRGCGPLSSTRKVGPELSRKIHTCFTSINGNQFLSET